MSSPPAAASPDPPLSLDPARVFFPGLDGLRAVAIALVYGFHDRDKLRLPSQAAGWVEVPLAMAVDPLLGAVGLPDVSYRLRNLLLRPVSTNGWVGVQVFFVLSGFLITTLLLRERERFGRVDLRAFWVRRALRIWPLYYLMVAVGFGVLPWAGHGWSAGNDAQLPAFLLFLGNWSMATRGMLPDPVSVLWSVCVEEQFYLFVPLLVAWLGGRLRLTLALALVAAGVAGRYYLTQTGLLGIGVHFNSLANLDTLMAGVILALVADRRPGLVRSNWAWRIAAVAGTGMVALVPLCLDGNGPARMALDKVMIWSWAVSLVVLSADPRERWSNALRWPRVVWVGQISYGIYLFHEYVLDGMLWLAQGLPRMPEVEFALALLGPAATVAVAALSYRYYEQPFLRLKRRWTRVPSRPIEAPAAPAIEPAPAPAGAAG